MKAEAYVLMFLASALPCARAAELAGTWQGHIKHGADTTYVGFDLEVSGGQITGNAYIPGWSYGHVNGRVEGDRFRFTVDQREFAGTVSGKTMALAWTANAVPFDVTLQRVESQITGPVEVNAAPKDLEGKWTAHFVGRIGPRPKMIGRIDFDFHVEGNTLTGMAHMPGWPGDCPISEGKIESGRFSFTATGRSPSSTGIPVMRFEGEVHSNGLKLDMRHQMFGADNGEALPLDAVRQ